ncbi:uncharacterized protein LOC143602641 [Bidens hawaiensis]|uniref:uncharacterized protein LOC143602641 n=1 Tax=Bidens hawaiensis TaxID=980011 RepID=UPI00404991FE
MATALENLTREIKELKAKVDKCEMCRGGHGTLECPFMNNQDVDFVVGQNRYPNAYNNNNQNWYSDKNLNQNQGQGNSNWRPADGPPGFQHPTTEIKTNITVKLKINLPFIEALQHMPKYAKFLKDLLKRKDRLGEVSSIPLMGDCLAVVLNRVPEKLSDPGVFTIPCLFGSDAMSHALADLGASINLMPYSLYEKLELGELTPTRMSLVKYRRGIIENLLVKVDKFVFLVDFVVLDMEVDERVPIILGRPFLHTAKAFIDVCFDFICGADLVGSNSLADCDDLGEEESCEDDSVCDELVEISSLPEIIVVNEISSENEAGSVEKPAPLELKVILSHLEYAYLDEGSNLPVIVSSKLTEEEKSKLIYEKLVSAPILCSPDWSLLFELMRDSSDYTVGAVLGQKRDKHFHPIYYASKTLNDARENYTTTEKELLAVVFAFDKFRSYLVLSKTTVFTDHAALRFLFQKKDAKPRLIRWILLLSEFDIEIIDKRGAENVAADHLSRLEDSKTEELREEEIRDTLPHESIDFGAAEKQGMTTQQKRKFFRDVNRYVWDDPFLFKIGGDRILRRCVTKEEGWDILKHFREGLTGGHHGARATAQKVFDSGFYWPTVVKDAEKFMKLCDACQRTEKVLARYGVTHRTTTTYRPQTNGQVENAN